MGPYRSYEDCGHERGSGISSQPYAHLAHIARTDRIGASVLPCCWSSARHFIPGVCLGTRASSVQAPPLCGGGGVRAKRQHLVLLDAASRSTASKTDFNAHFIKESEMMFQDAKHHCTLPCATHAVQNGEPRREQPQSAGSKVSSCSRELARSKRFDMGILRQQTCLMLVALSFQNTALHTKCAKPHEPRRQP